MHLDMEIVSPSSASFDEISKHLEFMEVLKTNQFVLNDDWFSEWHSVLSLCSPELKDDLCPQILTVGLESSQAGLFGKDWARSIHLNGLTPNLELDKNPLVFNGYNEARKNQLSNIERHFTHIDCVNGKQYVSYVRTVAEITTEKGSPLFVYLGSHQFLHLQ